ncbi:SDR family oxidoreductase [Mycobacterium sp. CBMA271]|uniref:SDR family NAD(P)-dependent oxidoreductase n=1 Tax=unclassified Mycobacteroides TaxID=2618759 RepID=UPI001322CB9C|nr:MULTISPECIES: SDR family oxidoreductase [unclassified Mycobacteroides]MUM16924.1 ketoacyl reductase [Mycobacteroides sp. CBMA 326]MUM24087.1 SDR family oxidoreductase [Mycobacteroides sp. CBMA 271]
MSLPKPGTNGPVVITGASSGIGTELAYGLAKRGYSLVLVARRKDRMDKLADILSARHRIEVDVQALDLGVDQGRDALGEWIAANRIAGLCNSAGFGTSGIFHEMPLDREREEIEVNVITLVALTHAAVAGMVARGTGAVLNIASVAAFQPIPYMATYAATKAYVQSFSEAVHEELRGTGVSCTVLCPGPVPTEWAEIASAERFSVPGVQVSPKQVSAAAIKGMLRGSRSVVPGAVPQAMTLAGRFTPRSLLLPALRLATNISER